MADGLDLSVFVVDTGQYVGFRCLKAVYDNGLAGKPALAGYLSSLDVGTIGYARYHIIALALSGNANVKRQSPIAFGRNFPQEIVGFVIDLFQLQESRPYFMGLGDEYGCEYRYFHFQRTASVLLAGYGKRISTS